MENSTEILDSDQIESNLETDEESIISLNRFIILTLVSFGLYEVWWIYKAWRYFKKKDLMDINPAARAIFSIFFLNELFNKILKLAKARGYQESFSPGLLYVGFILMNFLSRLPDPYWLISFLSVACLIPPFNAYNYARQNSGFYVEEQKTFSKGEIVVVVIGMLFWALVIIGLTMGEE